MIMFEEINCLKLLKLWRKYTLEEVEILSIICSILNGRRHTNTGYITYVGLHFY
jgi:hypothetical protein